MKRTVLIVIALFLALGSTGGTQNHPRSVREVEKLENAKSVQARRASGVAEGTGTVRYDPGIPTTRVTGTGQASYVGNLFDTSNGQALSPGTVTRLSWYQGAGCPTTYCNGTAPRAFANIFPNAGTISGRVGYFVNVLESAFNSITVAVPVLSQFFVGFYMNGDSAAPWGSLGAATATTQGQGFHGHRRSAFGGDSTPLPAINAVVRVSGSIIIPVELLDFELE